MQRFRVKKQKVHLKNITMILLLLFTLYSIVQTMFRRLKGT